MGATVELRDFVFNLVDADEFTLKYMETHPFDYPIANINSITSKIKMAIEPIYKDFCAKYLGDVMTTKSPNSQQRTYICFDTMRKALIDLLGNNIVEHEIVTFLRHFSAFNSSNAAGKKNCNRAFVQSLIQDELNRNLWNDLQKLKEYIYHVDPVNYNSFMPANKLYSIVQGSRLPIKQPLIEDMFSV